MNRVVINMDPQGCFEVFSDAPVEFFVVCDHVPADRVYQMSVEVGVEKVRKQLLTDPVGHSGDAFFQTRSQYGKKPPSKPGLEVVK